MREPWNTNFKLGLTNIPATKSNRMNLCYSYSSQAQCLKILKDFKYIFTFLIFRPISIEFNTPLCLALQDFKYILIPFGSSVSNSN